MDARLSGQRPADSQALRLLVWAIEADAIAANGGDVAKYWAKRKTGVLDSAYVRALAERVLHFTRKPLYKARFALRGFAAQLRRGRGWYSWYGAHQSFADQIADSVTTLAEKLPRPPRGNPDWFRGNTKSRAQRRVNVAHDRLIELAPSSGYLDWQREVATPGRAGKLSRGRDLIRRDAEKHATEADDLYDPTEQIRERIKSDRRSERRRAARQIRDE